ncbi:hypothetical protein E3N88_15995 [Mikania micrantha]|uniref:PB1 domain-containing protein n=1 Tax=Mikania micrantha TaxID=192012 RepID=A0A5N6P085_9ASTR|nr:hypothetical protein E3N88_15995 [Mikania micrantha]
MLERYKLPRWNDFFFDIPSAERRQITESELKKFVGLPVSKVVAYFKASESTIRALAKRCKIKLGLWIRSMKVVENQVAELFDLEKGAFTIKYVDDDGDLCILKKDVHMIAFKQGFKRRDTVRLQVEKNDLKILGVEKEG